MMDNQYADKLLTLMQTTINNLQAELLTVKARLQCLQEDNGILEEKLKEADEEKLKMAEDISKLKSRLSKVKKANGVKETKEENAKEDDGFVDAEYVEVDTKKSARK